MLIGGGSQLGKRGVDLKLGLTDSKHRRFLLPGWLWQGILCGLKSCEAEASLGGQECLLSGLC